MLDFSAAPFDFAPQDHTDELRRYLIDTLETWLPRLLPGGKTHSGEFRAGSVHGDPGGSLCVRLRGDSRGLWTDHSSGQGGDPFSLLMECLGCDFQTAIAQARDMAGLRIKPTPARLTKERSAQDDERVIRRILESASPQHELIEIYLRGRGITIDVPDDLLAHTRLWHGGDGSVHFGMVARVRNVSGAVIGLHRTYLTATAQHRVVKADVCPQKMMLGPCKGGSVRLAEGVDPACPVLGISEGIESGLSAMQLFGLPVWAALSTSGMRAIEVPAWIKRVVIFADFDPIDEKLGGRPGTMAAEALADRLTQGCEVRVVYPMHELCDFNDELRERGG